MPTEYEAAPRIPPQLLAQSVLAISRSACSASSPRSGHDVAEDGQLAYVFDATARQRAEICLQNFPVLPARHWNYGGLFSVSMTLGFKARVR